MSRRARKAEPIPDEGKVSEASVEVEEKKPETKIEEKPLKDIVKVKVKTGTLLWEGGSFEKDSVFECTREQALKFKPYVDIIEG